MYIYTRQTKCKIIKHGQSTRKNKNNTHKHLFLILHLIHFAVQPLAALCISLYRERERMTGKTKVNAALCIVSSFQNSSKKKNSKKVLIVYPTFNILLSIIYISSYSLDKNAIGRKCFHFVFNRICKSKIGNKIEKKRKKEGE